MVEDGRMWFEVRLQSRKLRKALSRREGEAQIPLARIAEEEKQIEAGLAHLIIFGRFMVTSMDQVGLRARWLQAETGMTHTAQTKSDLI